MLYFRVETQVFGHDIQSNLITLEKTHTEWIDYFHSLYLFWQKYKQAFWRIKKLEVIQSIKVLFKSLYNNDIDQSISTYILILETSNITCLQ